MKLSHMTLAAIGISFVFHHVHCRSISFLSHLHSYGLILLVWVSLVAGNLAFNIILWPKYFSPLRHLPEPTEGRSWWNGFGSKAFFGAKGELVSQWNRSLRHNGVFRYLDVLNFEKLAVTSPDMVAEVLQRTQDFEQHSTMYLLAEPILGPGIVIVNGQEHKRQRKLVAPLLSAQQVRELEPVFWEKSVELVQRLTEIAARTASASGFSEPILMDHYSSHVTLDSISKAALGIDFESLQNPDSELVRCYSGVFTPTKVFRLLAVAKMALPKQLVESFPHARVREAKRAITVVRDVCAAAVRRKKDILATGKGLTSNDTVSALIRDKGVCDEEELITHSMTMLGAGHETVGVGLTWSIYELCRCPQWQRDLRAEVRAHLPRPGSGDSPARHAFEPNNMPLLNAFVSESLRYHPPVSQIGRQAARDTTLGGGDGVVFVPAGVHVSLSIRSFNHDEGNWGSDAREFRPERWLRREGEEKDTLATYVPNGGALTKQAFMTFIHGGRDCIGRVFARSEMLHILAGLIGAFEFVLTEPAYADEKNIPVSGGGLTYKPAEGIHVHLRPVAGW
ncbi:cytochrome P450 [Xylariomycetidae sp. FL2044]|nr:cytochrome P450 [Xylariomycetidae sp. FL2044]